MVEVLQEFEDNASEQQAQSMAKGVELFNDRYWFLCVLECPC
jgi:hypothetical protein